MIVSPHAKVEYPASRVWPGLNSLHLRAAGVITMRMNAAVLWEFNAEWSVEEVHLDGPQDGEVLVSFEAAGLCHSDHHVRTGDLPVPLPIVGGHEGAGIVQEVGRGGIGSGAIQGARLAGAEKIVVVDIAESKRDKAFVFGATHFSTSMAEATALVGDLTHGVMADSAVLTVGVAEGHMIGEALDIVRKGGAVVLTALASITDVTATLPMAMFTLFQKRLLGSLYGEANPRADI